MQISNKLFNQQQLGHFGRLNNDIQQIQSKIASGKNILKASDDPLGAIQLSAVKDQKELLGKFSSNVSAAQVRLPITPRSGSRGQPRPEHRDATHRA